MSAENEREDTGGLSPKKAAYIALELAWAHFLPWAEPPTKLRMSTWYNLAGGDWKAVVALIEKASDTQDVADPQTFIWRKLRNYASTSAARRVSDADRVRTWHAPQGTA